MSDEKVVDRRNRVTCDEERITESRESDHQDGALGTRELKIYYEFVLDELTKSGWKLLAWLKLKNLPTRFRKSIENTHLKRTNYRTRLAS